MTTKNKKRSKEKERKYTCLLVRLLCLLSVIVATWLCSVYWFQLMLIEGDSMLPTYHHLQLVVLNKWERTYRPGDVVAFRCENLSSVLVKRIAACPGDTVWIDNMTLMVNNEVSKVYTKSGIFTKAGILEKHICLDMKQYIVLGDNTKESVDSRDMRVGIVQEEWIIGKVIP